MVCPPPPEAIRMEPSVYSSIPHGDKTADEVAPPWKTDREQKEINRRNKRGHEEKRKTDHLSWPQGHFQQRLHKCWFPNHNLKHFQPPAGWEDWWREGFLQGKVEWHGHKGSKHTHRCE